MTIPLTMQMQNLKHPWSTSRARPDAAPDVARPVDGEEQISARQAVVQATSLQFTLRENPLIIARAVGIRQGFLRCWIASVRTKGKESYTERS